MLTWHLKDYCSAYLLVFFGFGAILDLVKLGFVQVDARHFPQGVQSQPGRCFPWGLGAR